jgi:tripartite-type tricarboxylate transporter receptor subunit TctC
LFLSTLSIVTSQIINPDPAFDLVKDFAPISLLASGVVLVVSPQSNLSSVADIVALAKSKPDQVLCANAGIGSLPHMAAELFAQRAEIKLVHVFFSAFCASAVFGSVTVRTPFLKLASTLSSSTPSGTGKVRSNEPKLRSRT